MSISLNHVTVQVPDGDDTLTILNDLSMEVSRGQVLAITGSSGSGKSTLLAVAGLLRQPTEGEVCIEGQSTTALGTKGKAELRRTNIGLVFQSSNLFPSLTALEQVELVAHISGDLNAPSRQRARDLLVSVGLEHRLASRPAQLSGGERQRVGIARALMNAPTVLLADEPTASLDSERGAEVMDLLISHAVEREIATVIVSHNLDQLSRATSRMHLEAGKLVSVT